VKRPVLGINRSWRWVARAIWPRVCKVLSCRRPDRHRRLDPDRRAAGRIELSYGHVYAAFDCSRGVSDDTKLTVAVEILDAFRTRYVDPYRD
jgi:hypothetical protein